MRHLKTFVIMASLALTMLLGLVGCGDDHRNHIRSDRDRPPARYERHDNDRPQERHEGDRHEDRGNDGGHEGEHGDR